MRLKGSQTYNLGKRYKLKCLLFAIMHDANMIHTVHIVHIYFKLCFKKQHFFNVECKCYRVNIFEILKGLKLKHFGVKKQKFPVPCYSQ